MTGIMIEWAMSTIEDNLATSRVPSSALAWTESSKHGEDEKSRNTINVQLARKKSMIKHRSSNVSHPGENVVHAQPSVSHEEDEIQNSNFEYGEDPEEDDWKPAAKRIKKEPEDEAQSWAQDEQNQETTFKPWEDKKDYEAIFRKYICIGEDGEEHYDMIDMKIQPQRAVRPSRNSQTIPRSGEGI